MATMRRLLWWWRTLRGYCPKCNSDAPKIDMCGVCSGYRYPSPFPPPWYLRMKWLFLCELDKEEEAAIAATRRAEDGR